MEPEAAPSSPSSRTPFVGRDGELDELGGGLADALAGRAQLFLIAGEPGIGKTRLMDEVGERGRAQGATVVTGRAWSGGGAPPYWPWMQVLRACLGEGARVAELGRDRALLARIVPELHDDGDAPPPAGDSEQARFRLFDTTARLLARLTLERPHLLLFDDLHEADPSSLLLLQFVVRALRGSGLLVLATYRDAEVRRSPTMAAHMAALGREGRRLALRGLDEPHVAELVTSACRRAVPPALIAAVHHATGGNPFFVDEVVRTIVAERQWEKPLGAQRDLRVPDTVREAVRERLALLGDGVRELLGVAAVVGREFDLHLISRIPSCPAVPFLETIREASVAGLVHPTGQPGRFAFAHDLVRDTLRADLAPTRRVALHHELAELLESLAATEGEPSWAAMAHHFYFAAPLAGADKAVTYAARAGDQAMDQCAYEDAIALYGRALQAMYLRRGADTDAYGEGLERGELLLRLAKAERRVAPEATWRATLQRAATLVTRLLAERADPRAAALHAALTEASDGHEPRRDGDTSAPAVFRQEGDYWTLAFAGTLLRLKQGRGLFYLHHLLRHPGQDVLALDLVAAASGTVRTNAEREPYDGEAILDGAAKSAYRRRLADLREELDAAEAQNDLGRVEHLRGEMETIARELSSALGLGGRDRRAASSAERSRIAVTKAILVALKSIAAGNPALRSYLGNTIRTGRLCTFDPAAGPAVTWQL